LGAIVFVRWVGCLRLLRSSAVAPPLAIASLVDELALRLGVRRKVRLVVTSSQVGPATLGVFYPTILLPAAALDGKSLAPLEPILAHELIHIRRGDVLFGVLQLLAQLVWWFHPLVWWANRQACREAERCCDEEVVAGLGCRPVDYARCLLGVLELKQRLRAVFAFPGCARPKSPPNDWRTS
jgi:beta-lactamase regulating signal transducer with metallopeptidase domain